jgi:hypothetical protein
MLEQPLVHREDRLLLPTPRRPDLYGHSEKLLPPVDFAWAGAEPPNRQKGAEIPESDFDGTIETVRGRMSEERADQLLRFWSAHTALKEEAARRRLSEVVCVLLDADGEMAGVNSVYPQDVPLIGGRRFWIYRRFLLPDASDAEEEMINAAFRALEEEYEPTAGGPIGLCVMVADPTEMERRAEAIWTETELMFAGYLPDDRQVRIRYFEEAVIGPGLPNSPTLAEMRETRETDYPVEDRYRIEPFNEADDVTHDDVLALWERERAVVGERARKRLDEVFLVAIERDKGLVGVSTAYLQYNRQLRTDVWHYRVFVAAAHRKGNLAAQLTFKARDVLEQRYVTGEDARAPAIVYEVENEGLKRYYHKARGLPLDVTFLGENQRGDYVAVHYFPGARAPGPGGDEGHRY